MWSDKYEPPEEVKMRKYRKFMVAIAGAIGEGMALWADAPPLVTGLAAFVVAALVYAVPNDAPAE